MPTTIHFTKVADTTSLIPGGTGSFASFSSPALDRGVVAFRGGGANNQQGIYKFRDTLLAVADMTSPMPGGTGNFSSFGSPTVDAGQVAFLGSGSVMQQGYFADFDGLVMLANKSTSIPGGTGRFLGFGGTPGLSGTSIAFRGQGALGQDGIYLIRDGLKLIANTQTAIPSGNSAFTSFGNPAFDGEYLAFIGAGAGSQQGLYRYRDSVKILANKTSAFPDGTGNFLSLGSPALDRGKVVFVADGSGGQQGVFLDSGSLGTVATRQSLIPGGTGKFSSFSNPALDRGHVAFFGSGTGNQQGIYSDYPGDLTKIIDLQDTLDGKKVAMLTFSSDGFSESQIAFQANFVDGSQGVYLAQLTREQAVTVAPASFATTFKKREVVGFMGVLEIGQAAGLKDLGERYEVTVARGGTPGLTLELVEVGTDYLVILDPASGHEVRIPSRSIKCIVVQGLLR